MQILKKTEVLCLEEYFPHSTASLIFFHFNSHKIRDAFEMQINSLQKLIVMENQLNIA